MTRQLAILTTTVGLAVALVGCGSEGDGDAGPAPSRPTTAPTVDTTPATTAPPTTQAPAPTTTGPGPASAERLSPSSRLRVDGIGPVRVGMSLAEARAAAGVALEPASSEYCRSLRPAASNPFVTFIATSGDRIDVIEAGPSTATVSGIRIGSTEQQVVAAYGDRAQVINPHEPLHRIVYRAADPSLRDYALVFGIGDDRVTSMYAGTDSVLADELCA